MGIYSNFRIVKEAEDEDDFTVQTPNSESDDSPNENNGELDLKDDGDMTVDADKVESQSEEEAQNETEEQEDEANEDNDNVEDNTGDEANEDNDDFTIDADDAEDETSTEDNNEEEDTDSLSDETDTGDDPKAKFDAALYDSLSDTEKANKNAELLSNYKDLYINCDNIIDKINNIKKDTDNIKILQRVACTLGDIKVYISFYLDKVYNSKSYYENDVEFNKYLAILSGVKNVLKQLLDSKKDAKNDKKANSDK